MTKLSIFWVLLFLTLAEAALSAETATLSMEEVQAFKREVRRYLYTENDKEAEQVLQELLRFESRSPSEIKTMLRDPGGWEDRARGFREATFRV